MKNQGEVQSTCLSRHEQFAKGFKVGFPVALGYITVSFAFAVSISSGSSGLPWYLVVAICMSNFTSAGSAAGADLILLGSSLTEIGVTVLIINIRYALMSLALSQKMLKMPLGKRLLLANGVTDETFVLASRQEGQLSGWFFTGVAFGPYLGWSLGGLLGALAGAVLPASLSSALGIALYAMFIAIFVPAAKKSAPVLVVVLLSVGLSCLFRYVPVLQSVSSGWALIISAVGASAVGAAIFGERKTETEVSA